MTTTETLIDRCDVLVIGGGITGAGLALDAAARGLKAALVEKRDFAAGTSSRSTKLIHGGLRYLEHFDFSLVREALLERSVLTRIAPHLGKSHEAKIRGQRKKPDAEIPHSNQRKESACPGN